jgi:hypothetical protein
MGLCVTMNLVMLVNKNAFYFIFYKKLILFYYTFMRDTMTMICEPKLLLAQKQDGGVYIPHKK